MISFILSGLLAVCPDCQPAFHQAYLPAICLDGFLYSLSDCKLAANHAWLHEI